MTHASLLDPTGERTVARARAAARARRRSTGTTVGLLDISKPRGDVFLDRLEERLAERGADGAALREADVHQAGAGRPPPRDRHAVRRRDRGARRLRQLHVVQCARHRRSRAPGRAGGVRRVDASSSTPPSAQSHVARLPDRGRGVHAAPDPGPHRRRDAGATPTRPSTRSSPRSPPPESR